MSISAENQPSPCLTEFDNILVIQTLSKSRSLAGMRIGFAIGDPHLIHALERIRDSFNSYTLDSLAQTCAIAAFADGPWFETTELGSWPPGNAQ